MATSWYVNVCINKQSKKVIRLAIHSSPPGGVSTNLTEEWWAGLLNHKFDSHDDAVKFLVGEEWLQWTRELPGHPLYEKPTQHKPKLWDERGWKPK